MSTSHLTKCPRCNSDNFTVVSEDEGSGVAIVCDAEPVVGAVTKYQCWSCKEQFVEAELIDPSVKGMTKQ